MPLKCNFNRYYFIILLYRSAIVEGQNIISQHSLFLKKNRKKRKKKKKKEKEKEKEKEYH